MAQTHKNWEVVIVHDGQPQYVPEFEDDRIRFYSIAKIYNYPQDNKKAEWLAGPVNALNFALSQVNNEDGYIMRIDDDDILLPDAMAALVRYIFLFAYDFVSANWVNERNEQARPYSLRELGLNSDGNLGGVQTWIYRAEFKNIKYCPNCWMKPHNANNELDWFERFFKSGHRHIGWLERVVTKILPRPGETDIGSKAYVR